MGRGGGFLGTAAPGGSAARPEDKSSHATWNTKTSVCLGHWGGAEGAALYAWAPGGPAAPGTWAPACHARNAPTPPPPPKRPPPTQRAKGTALLMISVSLSVLVPNICCRSSPFR